MYKAAVGAWRLAPSEFWRMHPREWWWLWDYHQRQHRAATGEMSSAEVADLREWAEANKGKYVNKPRSNPPQDSR